MIHLTRETIYIQIKALVKQTEAVHRGFIFSEYLYGSGSIRKN